MFTPFFLRARWSLWSIFGSMLIVLGTWYAVEVNVRINEWFGVFYNLVQKALSGPNSVSPEALFLQCAIFAKIAGIYIIIIMFLRFFISHYVFRWRTAMTEYYSQYWSRIRHIEGVSQRIQDDTMRFATIMESLGAGLIDSILTLIAFLPLLWELSEQVTSIPIFGTVTHSLVYLAIGYSLFGTVLLVFAGIKLPGLNFEIQKTEAAYRKELVIGEDDEQYAKPPTLASLYKTVKKTYFRYYAHFLYFNIVRSSFLQFGHIFPMIFMVPTIVAGAITFGTFQQIIRAFDQVASSFQYLVNSWGDIVTVMSVYKRLHALELEINALDKQELNS